MPRNYFRKTAEGSWSCENVTNALNAVRQRGVSVKRPASCSASRGQFWGTDWRVTTQSGILLHRVWGAKASYLEISKKSLWDEFFTCRRHSTGSLLTSSPRRPLSLQSCKGSNIPSTKNPTELVETGSLIFAKTSRSGRQKSGEHEESTLPTPSLEAKRQKPAPGASRLGKATKVDLPKLSVDES